MALEDPNNAQAGLISVIVGAGAAWFGLYVNSTSTKHEDIKVATVAQTGVMPTATTSTSVNIDRTELDMDDDLPPPRRNL